MGLDAMGICLLTYKTSLQIKDITPVDNIAGHVIFLLTLFVMELKKKTKSFVEINLVIFTSHFFNFLTFEFFLIKLNVIGCAWSLKSPVDPSMIRKWKNVSLVVQGTGQIKWPSQILISPLLPLSSLASIFPCVTSPSSTSVFDYWGSEQLNDSFSRELLATLHFHLQVRVKREKNTTNNIMNALMFITYVKCFWHYIKFVLKKVMLKEHYHVWYCTNKFDLKSKVPRILS